MTVKRSRDERDDQVETAALADGLMLLSRVGMSISDDISEPTTTTASASSSDSLAAPSRRVFECKTCNKKFHSFQALGGHRASHKKLRLVAELLTQPDSQSAKAKKHECAICGLEFPLGQALGGHMRRHRAQLEERRENNCHSNNYNNTIVDQKPLPMQSVLKRSNSKRVFGFDLNLTPYENDLNLTPYENDLKQLRMNRSTAAAT